MSHEEEILQRLATLESEVRALMRHHADMASKIDQLAAVANIGKGALWALLKFGAVVAAMAGLVLAWVEWSRP